MPMAQKLVSWIVIFNLKIFTAITKRPRARVLVVNEQGQLLLIRAHISHGKWTLPGGGLERGESAVSAATRELYEETGIRVDESSLQYLATLERPAYDIPFSAPLFLVIVKSTSLPSAIHNPREIKSIGWFDRDTLPLPLSTTVTYALHLADTLA